jgi:hypothetical protein
MAQKVILIDDLDGSEGAETITYTVDGVQYEIDLSEKNAKRFRSTLEEFTRASPAPPPHLGAEADDSLSLDHLRRRTHL